VARATSQVDLFSERNEVREAVKKHLYTGKTHNSIESISQFFGARGIPVPQPPAAHKASPAVVPQAPARPVSPPAAAVKKQGGLRFGTAIQHPKYGRGTVLRIEGEGEDAKLTINFAGYGLKKLVAKYAGLKVEK
jgi:DNA helicase-2/ATP-dependent DNA helicase PcrA